MKGKPLAIYIHIPFCVKKCAYCDFLSAPASLDIQKKYVKALKQEIIAEAGRLLKNTREQKPNNKLEEIKLSDKDCTKKEQQSVDGSTQSRISGQKNECLTEYSVTSIFFGGGTPSILPAGIIADLLAVIREYFVVLPEAEITVECNPGTLDRKKLDSYLKAGVNRLSIGLQSANDQELALLGRIHTFRQFQENYQIAREAGFRNINIDLISGLPGQTVQVYENTIKEVLALAPEHISAYSLIVEEGTPFFEKYQAGKLLLPNEDTEREMYSLTGKLLCLSGYAQYEISNYAKPGFECRHNLCYWERQEYIGFGLGSASLIQKERFTRQRGLSEYLSAVETKRDTRIDRHRLEKKEEIEEFMFLGLRITRGVSKARFQQEFHLKMEEVYGDILKKYQKLGLLFIDQDTVALTPRGIDVSNIVLCDFLLDSFPDMEKQ